MKKRLLILIAAIVLVFSGCNNSDKADVKTEEKTEVKEEKKTETTDNKNEDGKNGEVITSTSELLKKEFKERTFGDELKKDSPAVDFDAVDLEGNKVTLKDVLRDDVLTYVDFFQTTCHFCVEAMPELMELNGRDDVQVVLVDVGESVEKVKEFMKEKNIELPIIVDESGEVAQKYYISGFPTGVFITGDATLKGGVVGKRPLEEMIQIVEKFK